MRPIFLCLSLLFSSILAAQSTDQVLIEFMSTKKHLGVVDRGAKVSDKFVFVNTSDQDVEVDMVSTCDCTQAKWTKGPIAPGKKGVISFIFDSSKKDVVEPIDVDVHFKNKDPKTGYPMVVFLSYTFKFPE